MAMITFRDKMVAIVIRVGVFARRVAS
jgi:hypothetical protein